jgi:hypothetical protein
MIGMGRWIDGRMVDVLMDGGWMDGWMDGWIVHAPLLI